MKIRILEIIVVACFMTACGHKNNSDSDGGVAELQRQIDGYHQQIAVDSYRAERAMKAIEQNSTKEIAVTFVPPAPTTANPSTAQKADSVRLAVDEVPLSEKQLAKKIEVQTPTVASPTPSPIRRVNILLVEENGNVSDCYKGVIATDVKITDHLQFSAEGKTINWGKRVAFSYSYADNDNPQVSIAGPSNEGFKRFNVLSSNIYRSVNGTFWYEDQGKYIQAPKGFGYAVLP